MLMRRNRWFGLGFLLIAALGCRSHPELSKSNEKGALQWKRFGGASSVTVFTIGSGNRIDTPAGEKVPELAVSCSSYFKSLDVMVGTAVEPEGGAVSLGFDGGGLSQKSWEAKSSQVKDHLVFALQPSDADQADILRQLRHSNDFQFEFTPKGGKPQRSSFKLLNINTLLDQEQNCKGASVRTP